MSATLHIHLQQDFIALPSEFTPSTSTNISHTDESSPSSHPFMSIDSLSPSRDPSSHSTHVAYTPSGTTLLQGVVLVSSARASLEVASLAITLNGTTHFHLYSTPTSTNNLHHTRHILHQQQFLIEPHPDPRKHTVLAMRDSDRSSSSRLTPFSLRSPSSLSEGLERASLSTFRTESEETDTTLPSLRPSSTFTSSSSPSSTTFAEQRRKLGEHIVSLPFSIPVPNHLPASVLTTHGGTIYQLEATLTLARKPQSLFSFLLQKSFSVKASTAVQIYRAGFKKTPYIPSPPSTISPPLDTTPLPSTLIVDRPPTRDVSPPSTVDQPSSSGSISYTWPNHLKMTIKAPHLELTPKSHIDLQIRLQMLGDHTPDMFKIRCLNVSLHERVIFRVQHPNDANKSMVVVGIRERIANRQNCTSSWDNMIATTASTRRSESSLERPTLGRCIRYVVPDSLRGANELYSPRTVNPSTCSPIQGQEQRARLSEYKVIAGEWGRKGLGEIDIEVQHFLRFALEVSVKDSPGGSAVKVEKNLGNIDVLVRGVPDEPDCDGTGLPTYQGSFATALASVQDAQLYERDVARGASAALVIIEWSGRSSLPSVAGRQSVSSMFSQYESRQNSCYSATPSDRGSHYDGHRKAAATAATMNKTKLR